LPGMRVAKDGSFETDTIPLYAGHRPGDVVEWRWQPPDTDHQAEAQQVGKIHCYGPTGFTIFADIDDTIKDSRVLSLPQLLKRTFTNIMEPIQYMPETFQYLQRTLATTESPDVAFHYISSTPYSLAPALNHFIANCSFPDGPFHLSPLRVKDPKTIVKYIEAMEFKVTEGRRLVAAYPQRKFLLFGDSAQKDSTSYGILLREDPDRQHYQCAFIRIATGVSAPLEAIKNRQSTLLKAFRGVDSDRFLFYKDPRELMDIDIVGGKCRPDTVTDDDDVFVRDGEEDAYQE